MKTKLVRVDALEINFVDSCCRKEFKLDTSSERKEGKGKGVGEKRLFIKHLKDPSEYDDFFDFENIKYFFFRKADLLDYLKEIKDEYLNPTQNYSQDITPFYNENLEYIKSLKDEYVKLEFKRTYDFQYRYYLVLVGRGKNNSNKIAYDFIYKIALPRITKLNFIKYRDEKTNNLYIYMKLSYFEKMLKLNNLELDTQKETPTNKEKIRKQQNKYRLNLLEKMPSCAITQVADDRILVACHIKPYAVCAEDEEFDVNNGVILTPTFHYMFDIGFISFDDDGSLLISPFLSNLNKTRLHIRDKQPCSINHKSKKYLKYHREHIFSKISIDENKFLELVK